MSLLTISTAPIVHYFIHADVVSRAVDLSSVGLCHNPLLLPALSMS